MLPPLTLDWTDLSATMESQQGQVRFHTLTIIVTVGERWGDLPLHNDYRAWPTPAW